jgi:hypothetical protein
MPADPFLFICGGVAARDDLWHRGGARRTDGEALDANRIQDDTPMAKVDDPEGAIAGGSAEFTAGGLNYQGWTSGQGEALGSEGAHHAIDLFRRLALN